MIINKSLLHGKRFFKVTHQEYIFQKLRIDELNYVMKSQLYQKIHKIMFEHVLRYIQYIMKLEHQLLVKHVYLHLHQSMLDKT